MLSTSCSVRLRKAFNKKDRTREPIKIFSAGNAGRRSEGRGRRLAVDRQNAATLAARCVALDRRRRGEVARLARYYRRTNYPSLRAAKSSQGSLERRLQRCSSAGHGRIEPGTGSPSHDVWQDSRLP